MARTTVVEKLLSWVEEDVDVFDGVWGRRCETPKAIVVLFRSVLDDAFDYVEYDRLDLMSFLRELVTDLDSDELFQLGTGLLHIQDKRYG